MRASLQIKPLIRAGVAIVIAWVVTFVVMLVSFYGDLPRQAALPVFMFSSWCIFPYETFTFSESAKQILTIGHWVVSVVTFTLAGSRLPMRWAFIVALLTIPLLAILGPALLHVIGF